MEATENSVKLNLEENVSLRDFATLRIGGTAKHLAHITSPEELMAAYEFAKSKKLPVIVLGGGSNVIFSDEPFNGLVLHLEIKDFEVIKSDPKNVWLRIGAGENWDEVVARAVQMNLSGIEALSLIPGSTGATPVQNVGAYGQEIKDVLETVEAYDTKAGQMVTLQNADCGFRYRDSIFKSEQIGRYVICAVTLKLSTGEPAEPKYASLKNYFEKRGIAKPSLQEIRDAVISIRLAKLPDPAKFPNVGSFFKNPIVEKKTFALLQAKHPEVIYNGLADGRIKISAGWLIEQSGLKGHHHKNLGTSENNALVVINYGASSYKDLMELKELIVSTVKEKFGIELAQEPQVLH